MMVYRTCVIPLTQGQVALVSELDYADLIKYKWRATKHKRSLTFYAVRWERGWHMGLKKSRKLIQMANQIMCPPEGWEVDHLNHNGLDNQRSNLKIVTRRENNCNRRKYERGPSYSRGCIWWNKSRKKFEASLTLHGRRKNLGRFRLYVEAKAAITKELYDNGYCALPI
jgi:hypothetical protein